MKTISKMRPAAVIVGAVSVGLCGMAVFAGAPVGLAVVGVVLFWLV